MKKLDLSGKIFGRVSVLQLVGKDNSNKTLWKCVCDCGIVKVIRGSDLVSGKIKSCGCFNVEINTRLKTTHNQTNASFYKKWNSLLTRCNNPNFKNFKYWGGKGIKCRWRSFAEFESDMHESYLSHVGLFGEKQTTIDRIDSNEDYFFRYPIHRLRRFVSS